MEKYSFLFDLFSFFTYALQFNWEEHRSGFCEQVSYGHFQVEIIRTEFKEALDDTHFEWKEHLKEQGFFLYNDCKTKEELILDLKLLCWDVIFPELVFNQGEQEMLKGLVCEVLLEKNILSSEEAISEENLIRILLKIDQKWRLVNTYELLRLQKFSTTNEIAIRHECGTSKWFFYLI